MKRTTAPGIWIVALLWGCNDDGATRPPADVTPPAAVQDLNASNLDGHRIRLTWTAPGDDGITGRASQYEVRYASAPITAENWDSAAAIAEPPPPRDAGAPEQLLVDDLPYGTWHFAVKTADEVPNWSDISNPADEELSDQVPPAAVTDLRAQSAGARSVILAWTAPGDDGAEGRAASYELRYAPDRIFEETWAQAAPVAGLPSPSPAGAPETFTVEGLQPGRTYYFALKSVDAHLNWSGISNVVTSSTVLLRRLTNSPSGSYIGRAAWSPDGTQIAFSASWGPGGKTEVFVIPVEGGEAVQWTNDAKTDYAAGPTWSPDGSRIAFAARVRESGRNEIRVMEATPGASPVTLVGSDQWLELPAWSPDGLEVAYTRWTVPQAEAWIEALPAAGGPPRAIVQHPSINYGPAWSGDGSRLAFVSARSGVHEIWTISAEGTDPIRVTTGGGGSVAWSPDGTRLAMVSLRSGMVDLWMMSDTGDNLTQLTNDPSLEDYPAWSPDSRAIAFSSDRESGIGNIWIMNLE